MTFSVFLCWVRISLLPCYLNLMVFPIHSTHSKAPESFIHSYTIWLHTLHWHYASHLGLDNSQNTHGCFFLGAYSPMGETYITRRTMKIKVKLQFCLIIREEFVVDWDTKESSGDVLACSRSISLNISFKAWGLSRLQDLRGQNTIEKRTHWGDPKFYSLSSWKFPLICTSTGQKNLSRNQKARGRRADREMASWLGYIKLVNSPTERGRL